MIDKATEEQEYILSNFKKKFSNNYDIPIILYGLGINTQYLLKHLKQYNIIGLMDAENSGKKFWGYPVLSIEEAREKAKVIIIVARRMFQKIIYKRINNLQSDGIEICNLIEMDFEIDNNQKEFQHNLYWKKSEDELKQLILDHDIISFDIFDTLIMRKVLRPYNIFDIVEKELKDKLHINIPFREYRIQAEELLKKKCATPSYGDIYNKFTNMLNIDKKTKGVIMDKEFEVEITYAIARTKMVEMLEYAINNNKKVYLTSDMYFNRSQIKILLNSCGIHSYTDIIVSSEYKMTKEEGSLYNVLRRNKGKIIHIGDNFHIDFLQAKRYQINAYYIMSAYELLMNSSMSHLLSNINSIYDNIMVGLFVAKSLNNPFALNKTRGFISIDSAIDLGYCFYGAFTFVFMHWLINQINDEDGTILFAARDGYLVYQLYNLLRKKLHIKRLPKEKYFLTSRRAVSVATIHNRHDIERIIVETALNCTLGDVLKTKFGIDAIPEDSHKNQVISTTVEKDYLHQYVLKYETEILDNSEWERVNYQKYLNRENINVNNKIFLFDLVSSGTIPFYVERLLNKKVSGVCFATTNLPNRYFKDNKYIKSMLGNYFSSDKQWNFLKYYLLWESIFTADTGQLLHFDNNGMPVYVLSNLARKNFKEIKKVHSGIIAYVKDILELNLNLKQSYWSYKLADLIWGGITPQYSKISNQLKYIFIFENEYDKVKEQYIWDSLF
ncbi:hypothetical protein [Anaerosinus sp.]